LTNTSASFTITPLSVKVEWTNTSLIYNGSLQKPVATIAGVSGTITLTVSGEQKNVGTYTAFASTTNTNYTLTDASASFTISPASAVVNWTNTILTYNGLPQKPTATITGLGDDGTITLDVTGEQTDVGNDYTATAHSNAASANYTLTDYITSFSITTKSATVVWSEPTLTYNGLEQAPTATLDGVPLTVTGAKKDVGNGYTATAVAPNGYTLTNKTTTFAIVAKEVTVNWSNLTLTFNGSEQAPTATITGEANEGTITLAVSDGAVNVGHYSATASAPSANYILKNQTEDFEIVPKPVTVVWTNTDLTYNGYTQKPTATFTDVNDKVVNLNVLGEYKDVGTYIATADAPGNNYSLTGLTSASFTISPASANVDWSNRSLTYNGLPQKPTATIAGLGDDGTITLDVTGEQTAMGSNYPATAHGNAASVNYTLADTTTTFNITAKTITVLWTNTTLTYNGDIQTPTATYNGVALTVTGGMKDVGNGYVATAAAPANCTLSNPTATFAITPKEVTVNWTNLVLTYDRTLQCPTATITGEASEGTITLDVSGHMRYVGTGYLATASTTDKNYTLTNPTEYFDIVPKEVTVEWSDTSLTYNGELQKPVAKITCIPGDDLYITTIDVVGEQKNVGVYTAETSLINAHQLIRNYTLVGTTTRFTISTASATVVWTDTALIYTGAPQKPAATIAGVGSDGVITLDVTGAQTVVGSNYPATAHGNAASVNYTLIDTTTTFSIAQKHITVAWSDTTLIYNGLDQSPTATYNGVPLTVTGARKDVGNYAATAIASDANYFIDNPTTTFAIVAKAINVVWTNTDLVYDNKLQAPVAIAEGMTLTVVGAETEAGDYTATATLNDANYTLVDAETPFTIAPKPLTVIWGSLSLPYNGLPQVPAATADTLALTVTGSGEHTVVGAYTATASTANPNFTLTGNTASYNITANEVTVEWNNLSLTYNGEMQKPTASIPDGAGGTITLTVSGEQKNAGTYTATVPSTYAGYTLTNNSAEFTIAPLSVKVRWTDTLLTYNGALQKPNATIAGAGLDGTIELTVSGEQKNVGTYTASASTTNSNYTLTGASTSFTVSPLAATVVWNDTVLIYSGAPQTPTATITGVSGDGVIALDVRDAKTNASDNYPATAYGNAASANYSLLNTTTTFDIKPKNVAVVWGDTTFIYSGQLQAPTATAEGVVLSVCCAQSNVGSHTATASTLDTNYTLSNATTTFSIVAKDVTVNWTNLILTYSGAAQAPTATITGESGTITLAVGGSGTNVGKYTATASSPGVNYALVNPTAEFEIIPKPATVVWADTSLTYNGSAQKPTAKIVGVSGDIALDVTGEQRNVGVYSALAGTTDANYTLTGASATFTISPLSAAVDWTNTTLTYNGAPQTPTAKITGVSGDGIITLDVTGAQTDAADGYPATAFCGSIASANYTLTNATTTFDIKPKDVEVVWSDTTLVYNGQPQLPTAKADTLALTITATGKHTVTGIYHATAFASNPNFTLLNATVDFRIVLKKVTVMWTNTTLTYNGADQQPTATITGVNGEEITLDVTGKWTNAGTYTATANGSGYTNYELIDASHSFEIIPKTVTVDWANTTLTYNGASQQPTATITGVDADGVISLTVSGEQRNVGAYVAIASCSNANYTLEGATSPFAIVAKPAAVVWSNTNLIYNGRPQAPTATITGVSGDGVIMLDVTGEQTNAGDNYPATAHGNAASVNYTLNNIDTTFDIVPKEVKVEWGDTTLTYNGKKQTPTATAEGVTLTVSGAESEAGSGYTAAASTADANFTLANATTSFRIVPQTVNVVWTNTNLVYDNSLQAPTAIADTLHLTVSGAETDAGTYAATAYTGNANFTLANMTTPFTIAPKKVTVIWGDLNLPYSGYPQVPAATADTVALTVTGTSTHTDVGQYTATASTANANFTLLNATTLYNIVADAVTVEWSNLTLVYDNKAQAPTATVPDGVGGTFTLDVSGAQTDAGTYTATASTTDPRFTLINTKATFIIEPKPLEVMWSNTSLFYSGYVQSPTAKADTLALVVSGGQQNVGTYTATASSANPNFTLSRTSTSFSIYPALAGVKWSNTDLIYNGQPQKPKATVAGFGADGIIELDVTGEQTDAGDNYPATAHGNAASANYQLYNIDSTFNIAQKEVAVVWGNSILTYNGLPQTPTATADTLKLSISGAQTDAGSDYKATASTNNPNFTLTNVEKNFSIIAKVVNVVWTNTALTYNNRAQKPTAIADSVVLTVSGEKTDAGTYTATASTANPNITLDNATTQFTIAPLSVTVVWGSLTLPYIGENQTPTATADTLKLSISGAQRNVGSDYTTGASSRNPNFTLVNADTTFAIVAKSVNVDWTNTILTYNGFDQKPAASIQGAGDDGELTLNVSGAKKDAGKYTATATLSNPNYTLVGNSHDFEIIPKPATVVWTDTVLTYSGSMQKPLATITGEGGDGVIALNVSGEQRNVGEYLASATCSDSNYTLTDASVSFTITAKVASVVWDNTALTYNGSPQKPTARINDVDGEITLDVSGEQTDAGYNYPATAHGNAASANYTLSNDETVFDIAPLKVNVKWGSLTLPYNGQPQTPEATADTLKLTVTGSDEHTDIGSYTATASTANPNFTLDNASKSYSIVAAEITVVWTNTTLVYNGYKQRPTATITGLGGEGVITLNVSGEQQDVGNYTAIADYSDPNYTLVSDSHSFEIIPKPVAVDWDSLTLTYSGVAQKPAASITGEGNDGVIALDVSGAQKNVGAYVAIASSSNNNYTLTGTTSPFRIVAKEAAVVWSNTDLTYNGQSQKPVAKIIGEDADGEITLDVSGAQTDAGNNYPATASGNSSSVNYTLINIDTTFNIAPKELAVVWGDTTLIYNALPQTPTATADTLHLKFSGAETEVGAGYMATASTVNANFTLTNTTASFSIVPKTVTVVWTNTDLVYNNKPQKPTAIADTLTLTVTGEATEVGNYTATASVNNANFTLDNTTTPFTVAPKSISVQWTNLTLVYDNKPQKPTAIADTLQLTVSGAQTVAGTGYEATASTSNTNFTLTDNSTLFEIIPKKLSVVWGNTSLTYNGLPQTPPATADSLSLVVSGAQTDVGTGYVAIASSANANFTLSNDTTTFSIAAKTATVVWTNTALTYNGKPQKPTAIIVGEAEEGDITLTVSGEQTDAGTYTATAALSDTNYTLTNATMSFKISPKDVKVLWDNTTLTYSAQQQQPTAKADSLALTVSGAQRNVGTYTATATTANPNFTLSNASTSFDIVAKSAYVTWTNTVLTYSGVAQMPEASITGAGDDGVISLDVSGAQTDAGNSYPATASGTVYSVNYTLTNTETTFDILPKGIDVVWGSLTLPYNGAAQVPEATADTLALTVTGSGEHIDIGSYSATALTANPNFTLNNAGKTYSIIEKTVAVEWSDTLLYYNGELQKPTATITGAGDSIISLTVTGEKQNVGEYTATAALPLRNDNYTLVGTIHPYSILPKPSQVIWTDTALIYNGLAQKPAATIVGEGSDSTVTLDVAGEQTEAGRYIAVASLADPNYALVGDTTKFDIAPKALTVVWSDTLLTYNAAVQSPQATADTFKLEVSGGQKNVGEYPAKVVNWNNPNFVLSNTGTDFTIVPNSLIINWTDTLLVYNNKAQIPQAAIKGVGDDSLKNMSICVKGEQTVAGDYIATASCLDFYSNYVFVNPEQAFRIAPDTVAVIWRDTVFTYNGAPHLPSAQAAAPADTLALTITGEQTEAGGHTATATSAWNNPNFVLTDTSVNFTINANEIEVVWDTATRLVYNGKPQKPSATADTLALAIEGEQTDADTGYVAVAVSANPNYKLANDTLHFNIAPDTLSLHWSDTLFVYDSAMHLPAVAVDTLDLHWNLMTDSRDTLPLAVVDSADKAGVYTAVASTSNTNYHLFNAEQTFVIAPDTVKIDWDDPDIEISGGDDSATFSIGDTVVFVYDGKPHLPQINIPSLPDGSYHVEGGRTDAGEGIAIIVSDDPNYAFGNDTIIFFIAPDTISLQWSDTLFVYDSAMHLPTATFDTLDLHWNDATGSRDTLSLIVGDSVRAAGIYTAVASSTNGNYRLFNFNQSFTIAPDTVKIDWNDPDIHISGDDPSDSTTYSIGDTIVFVYDGKPHLPQVNIPSLPDSAYHVEGEQTDAGEGAAIIVSNDPNYAFDSDTIIFIIAPDTIRLQWSDTLFVYDSAMHIPTATFDTLDLHWNYTTNSRDSLSLTVADSARETGVYTAVAYSSNSNYWLFNAEQQFVIEPDLLPVQWSDTLFVYDGMPHLPQALVLDANADTVEITVSGAQTVAGRHQAVAAPVDPKYRLANDTVYFSIKPRLLFIGVDIADKYYDGTTTAVIKDTVIYSLVASDSAAIATSGIITGDSVRLAGGEASFDTPDIGNDKPVNILLPFYLVGADSANYILEFPDSALSGNILPPLSNEALLLRLFANSNEVEITSKDLIYKARCNEDNVALSCIVSEGAIARLTIDDVEYSNEDTIPINAATVTAFIDVQSASAKVTDRYTLRIIPALKDTLYYQRWDDVLALNTNIETNGNVPVYELRWFYSDGTYIYSDKYIDMSDLGTTDTDNYYAEVLLKDETEWRRVCSVVQKRVVHSLVAYPNPLPYGETLKIKLPAEYDGAKANVYSITGALMQADIPLHGSIADVDLQHFGSGIYILTVTGNNGAKESVTVIVE
jgi:hypothetical protein